MKGARASARFNVDLHGDGEEPVWKTRRIGSASSSFSPSSSAFQGIPRTRTTMRTRRMVCSEFFRTGSERRAPVTEFLNRYGF
jgi:hypothetical protein